MTHAEIIRTWPDASPEDVERIKRYQKGDSYRFAPPPVSTARWDDLSWARWVTFDEPHDHTTIEEQTP